MSKKIKEKTTKITLFITNKRKLFEKDDSIGGFYDVKCWINGKRTKNPVLKITYKTSDLKY